MAVLQMQRISICGLKKYRKPILETLQSLGTVEINHVIEEDADFQKMDVTDARISFEKAAAMTDRALEELDVYAPEKQSLLASLAGKEPISKQQYESIISNREVLLEKANEVLALDKECAESKATIAKLENQIEGLQPWMNLDVPVEDVVTEHTTTFIGVISAVATLETVYEGLAKELPEAEVDVQIISTASNMTCLAVTCLTKEAPQVEEALRTQGFAKPSQSFSAAPAQEKQQLEQEIQTQEKRIQEAQEKIVKLAENREDFRELADYYRVRADKYEVLGTLPQSKRTFVISGYIPEKQIKRVEAALEPYECVIDVEDVGEEEDVPVILQNNVFSACSEGIVQSYSLPGKGDVDPTTIMSVFYVFFFGLMLADAGYGALVSLACGIVLLKFPHMSASLKKSLQLFFWCGLSTLFWGVMFGGYFGDTINVVSRVFLGKEVTIPALWFVPLENPMKLLIYSLAFGVVHLFAGLGIKGYMCLKDKQYMAFFCDVILWYILLIGLLLMLIPSSIFASIAGTQITFPPALNTLAKGMAIFGAAGIVLMSGRDKKNFGLRLALGAYDLYNVSGWLSDVLSYSRLLALGLASGVIAQVVNQMGSMFGNGVIGIILFTLIFLVGHALNLAINLLGAYVHTNRLQYVEFFGKFYDGGGREFEPFKKNTKYTDLKEEV